MATWNSPLPPTAVEGADTHVEDHNAIVAAIKEVRSNVDNVETATEAAQTTADEKQDAGDYASADALAQLAARIDALENPED